MFHSLIRRSVRDSSEELIDYCWHLRVYGLPLEFRTIRLLKSEHMGKPITKVDCVSEDVDHNYDVPKSPRSNLLNDLDAKEWIKETVSVWTQKGLGRGHKDAQLEALHPAPFSFQDVARLIRFFTKSGQTVLDPFVGVGSTLKAAAIEGRRGIGIELNPKYVQIAKERLATEIRDELFACHDQQILQGDAFEILPQIPEKSVHLVVTSPPYWNILHKVDHKANQERIARKLDTRYSDNDKDLGNIPEYPLFLNRLTDALDLAGSRLAPRGHMAVILGDFRHKTKYYMLHADVANALEQRGYSLKGVTILYQRHKRIFPYGYPYAYVPNLHHQYILLLRK